MSSPRSPDEAPGRARLAHGLELLPDLDEVVRLADVVVSIVPPERAPAVAADIAAAARRVDADPLVADLNAIAPATARAIETRLAGSGLELVDGSISGGPPRPDGSTRVYLSGARARELAALPAPGIEAHLVGTEVGIASAVKMSTASVYKGTVGLLAHALLAAHANGVLSFVLDDLRDSYPELVERAAHRDRAGGDEGRALRGRDAGDRRNPGGGRAAARALRRLRRALRRLLPQRARFGNAGVDRCGREPRGRPRCPRAGPLTPVTRATFGAPEAGKRNDTGHKEDE